MTISWKSHSCILTRRKGSSNSYYSNPRSQGQIKIHQKSKKRTCRHLFPYLISSSPYSASRADNKNRPKVNDTHTHRLYIPQRNIYLFGNTRPSGIKKNGSAHSYTYTWTLPPDGFSQDTSRRYIHAAQPVTQPRGASKTLRIYPICPYSNPKERESLLIIFSDSLWRIFSLSPLFSRV